MGNYTFFVKDPSQWEESNKTLWGCHDICPSLPRFHMALVTCPEVSALTHSGAWGDAKKLWGDLAFLLIAPKKTIQGEVAFGLTMVWAHPYQACFSSMNEAAKNWPCSSTLVIIGPTLLCGSTKMPNMCSSLKRVTLVP